VRCRSVGCAAPRFASAAYEGAQVDRIDWACLDLRGAVDLKNDSSFVCTGRRGSDRPCHRATIPSRALFQPLAGPASSFSDHCGRRGSYSGPLLRPVGGWELFKKPSHMLQVWYRRQLTGATNASRLIIVTYPPSPSPRRGLALPLGRRLLGCARCILFRPREGR
jgi:hypothetical protein